MIIFNYGIPRSGTILTNAIVRHFLANRGWSFANENMPNDPKRLAQYVARLRSTDAHLYRNVILHGHVWHAGLNDFLARDRGLRAIVNFRDLRDVTVSLMKLHEKNWEEAAKHAKATAQNMIPLIESSYSLALRYEISVQNRVVLADRIGQHLGLVPTARELDEIAGATSREKHKAIMERVRDGDAEMSLREIQNSNRLLREDKDTLINDRHIQSGDTGRWRDELPEEVHSRVTEMLAPELERLGYSLQ